jgi:S1-C subfamily serine protease
MAIDVTCPDCGADYSVPETLAGKRIKCKACGGPIAVDDDPAPVAAAKPVPAKPLTARPVKAAAIVDDDDRPTPAARKPRYSSDEDDTPVRPTRGGRGNGLPPAKKKSALPLVLGGLFAVCVLVGGVGAGLVFSGVLDDKPAGNANDFAANNPPPAMPGGDPVLPGKPAAGGNDVKPKGDPKSKTPALLEGDSIPSPDDGDSGKGAIVVTPAQPIKKAPGVATASEPRQSMDQLALDRAKEAAVYIEVESNGGKASGSGWFGMEPNLVFTNAHVVDMLAPNAEKPKKITVWVNPGTNKERIVPHAHMEILAVDRFADLCVIRVLNEADLPVPLKIRPSQQIRDLEPLVIIGYPGGRLMSRMTNSTKAPVATVNQTNFSNLRYDDNGNVNFVQTRGGAFKGNSGGPIIDYNGNVATMVVSGPAQAEFAAIINYGIPTEQIAGLLAGRVADIEYGQAYRKGGKVHVPVKANVLDPFHRMKEVRVAAWVGDASKKTRPPGPKRTGEEPSDGPVTEAKLDYKWTKEKPLATGELIYSDLTAGRAYWAQPVFSNSINDSYWMPGSTVKLDGPPVDPEEADLIYRPAFGRGRPTTLSHSSYLREFEAGERTEVSESDLLQTETKATETLQRTKDQGAVAEAVLQFDSLEFKATNDEGSREDILARGLPKEFRDLLARNVKLVQGVGFVQQDGSITKTLSNLRAAAPALKPLLSRFSDDAMQALVDAGVPLPNKRVQPNHTWNQDKNVRFRVGYEAPDEKAAPPSSRGRSPKLTKVKEYKYVESVTYTYLGTRTRLGTKEAVVKVDGVIKPAPGTASQGGASGSVKGYAYIDVNNGTVIESELKKEFEMDSSGDGVKKVIASSSNSKVTRGSAR